MKPVLYPSLERIRRELFEKGGNSRVDIDAEECDQIDPSLEAVAATPLPAHLLDLIRRQADAARAHPPSPPAVGQIRYLSSVPVITGGGRQLGRGCGILLGAHLVGKLWSGWLVSQEVDYATDRDLVIEEDDGPIDPVAGMVQTWNPIRVTINGSERILGKLSPLRLAAVMALAETSASDGEAKPQPGKVYGRDLSDGIVVATGSPLGGTDDPRHEYRALYQQLAAEIVAASGPVSASTATHSGIAGWLVHTFVRPAWTFAAIAASTVLALHALFGSGTGEIERLGYSGGRPVSKPAAPPSDKTLRVMLSEDADLGALRNLLSLPGITVRHIEFDGNSAVVWIQLSQANTDAIGRVKQLPGIRSVEVIAE